MTLPGIGEVLAQNIIDYRTKNGPFSSTEEIKEVNRIGDKLYEQLKDRISV
jgi:competence protein ComEA